MNEHPVRLRARFTHLLRSGETLVFVGDEDSRLLTLPEATEVLRLVDGRRSAHQIAAELNGVHPPAVVHFVILTLEKEGILEPGNQDSPGSRTALAGSGAAHRLAQALRDAWHTREEAAYARVEQDLLPSFELVLAEDYLHPSMLDLTAVETQRPLLLVRMTSDRTWVGPTVSRSAGAACVACLQERLKLNLAAAALAHRGGAADEEIEVVPLRRPLSDDAFARTARAIVVFGRGVSSTIVVVESDAGTSRHAVPRLPQCGACGDPERREPGAAIRLVPRARTRRGGAYRHVALARTLETYSPVVSPLTGVVRRIRKVPVNGSRGLIHVYTASHAVSAAPPSLRAVRDDLRDHAGGKGRTDPDARVSALCESLERFSSVHRGTERTRSARRSDLGELAIPPDALLLFSSSQFEGRVAWNQRQSGHFQQIPDPYRDEPIEWSEVRSLTTGELRWIPSAYLFTGFRGEGTRFCKADSNGLAGGNCLEEAILQGCLELIERDAVAIWWYNQLRRPGVDLDRVEDPWVHDVRDYYGSLGRTLWALDLTHDLGIPCFAALSARSVGASEEPIFGFGAHLDASIALSRAITEVNQMLPTVLRSGAERRRQLLPDFAEAIAWWEHARLDEHPHLLPDPEWPPVDPHAYEVPRTANLLDDVQYCIDRARAGGLDVLVHDLTRPDVGYPVAKVLVPGLRHFWRRLGPGRLYDAPVALGWLDTPIDEPNMNPVSMFV